MVDIDQQTKEAKREEKYEESKKQHTQINNDKEGDKEEEVVEVSTMAIRCCNSKPNTVFFFFF